MIENKTDKKKSRRLAKSQRIHNRRVKQAARKEIGTNNPQAGPPKPGIIPPKQEPAK